MWLHLRNGSSKGIEATGAVLRSAVGVEVTHRFGHVLVVSLGLGCQAPTPAPPPPPALSSPPDTSEATPGPQVDTSRRSLDAAAAAPRPTSTSSSSLAAVLASAYAAASATSRSGDLEGPSRPFAGLDVHSCSREGPERGSGHATVTFAQTGEVVSVVLDHGPFAKTAIGACVIRELSRARVPPFGAPDAGPARIGKSFAIN